MARDARRLIGLRRGAGWALVLLPLLLLGVAFFRPLWEVLSLGLRVDEGWSLARLGRLLDDPYVRRLLGFTLRQALLSAGLSLALGLPMGWLLTRYRFPGKGLLRALTLVPFVLPSITVALGFILFFGHAGYLNRFLLDTFGLVDPPIRVLYTLWGIVLAHAFYNAPVVARFVHVAWEQQDPSLTEGARVLGVGPWRSFLTVTLPLLLPALTSALTLVFVLCFLSFSIPLALGGARYATAEVGVYLFARVYGDLPRAAALATLMLGISLGLTYLYIRGGGLFHAPSRGLRSQPTVPLLSRQRPGRVLWTLYLVLAGLIFAGPIAAIVADSLMRVPPGGTAPTLHWYRMILSPAWNPFLEGSPLGALRTSLTVAASATGLALVLGTAVGWTLKQVRSRALETLLMAPLAVSSVVLGLALLLAFRRPPLAGLGGPWAIVFAHTLIVYPFVVRSVRPMWESLDPRLVEAARTLGAGRLSAFLTVELPLLRGGLVAAGAFAFALSLGEMTSVAMLSGPGLVTMPLAIYQFLSQRSFGAASAMATLLIAVTAASAWIWDRIGQGFGRAHERR